MDKLAAHIAERMLSHPCTPTHTARIAVALSRLRRRPRGKLLHGMMRCMLEQAHNANAQHAANVLIALARTGVASRGAVAMWVEEMTELVLAAGEEASVLDALQLSEALALMGHSCDSDQLSRIEAFCLSR